MCYKKHYLPTSRILYNTVAINNLASLVENLKIKNREIIKILHRKTDTLKYCVPSHLITPLLAKNGSRTS